MKTIIALLALLTSIVNTTAEDQITVTKVHGYPAVGDTSDTSDTVIAKFSGNDFEALRQDAEAVAKWMGEEDRWTDFPPDSGYVSVALRLGERSYIIDSWYPLFQEKDRIAFKAKREGSDSDKYKALYSFLDKIMGK